MNTSTKVVVIAACACLVAWAMKKIADQRTEDYPLSLVNLMRGIERQKHAVQAVP